MKYSSSLLGCSPTCTTALWCHRCTKRWCLRSMAKRFGPPLLVRHITTQINYPWNSWIASWIGWHDSVSGTWFPLVHYSLSTNAFACSGRKAIWHQERVRQSSPFLRAQVFHLSLPEPGNLPTMVMESKDKGESNLSVLPYRFLCSLQQITQASNRWGCPPTSCAVIWIRCSLKIWNKDLTILCFDSGRYRTICSFFFHVHFYGYITIVLLISFFIAKCAFTCLQNWLFYERLPYLDFLLTYNARICGIHLW
jgi:hypothetical protein